MTRLEDLQPTAAVRGILPEQVVTVVSVQWFGSEALELTYKGPSGRVANELLFNTLPTVVCDATSWLQLPKSALQRS